MIKDPNCTECGHVFKPEDGCYNFPDGIKCDDCGDKDQRTMRWVNKYEKKVEVKPQTVKLEGYDIDLKLLMDYADQVEDTRRALVFSHGRQNPLRIQKSLEKREVQHAKIMKSLGIEYNSNESFPITGAINGWIKKTQTKVDTN